MMNCSMLEASSQAVNVQAMNQFVAHQCYDLVVMLFLEEYMFMFISTM